MPVASSDAGFASFLKNLGAVTPEQLAAARSAQAVALQNGEQVSLADVLVQQGVLTQAIKDRLENKYLAQNSSQQPAVQSEARHLQLGTFKLIKKLGEGGMGAVFLAEDIAVGRKVALKVLPKRLSENPEFVARFRREAKAAGKLNHPNIVAAYSVGEENGNNYYAMEFCEGEPLDATLKREGSLPWDRAIDIAAQVTRGLKYAHDHGIVHRDIKPANIFLTREGTAKILDLGLSKNIGDAEQSFKTQTGAIMGTPHYISPEQASGDKNLDGRTDIYSLGGSLYHLLTGETPFDGPTALVIMSKHLNEQLANPQDINPDIPDAIVQVIQRMMAKDPAHRYENCAILLEDLELVMAGKMPARAGLDSRLSSIALAKPRAHKVAGAARKAAPRKSAEEHDRPDRYPKAKARQIADMKIYSGAAAAAVLLLAFMMFKGKSADEPKAPTPPPEKIAEVKPPVAQPQPVKPPQQNPAPATPPPSTPAAAPKLPDVEDAWVAEVQRLGREELSQTVGKKLYDMNPNAECNFHFTCEGERVTEFSVIEADNRFENLAPLRALHGLEKVECNQTAVKDLGFLKSLPIRYLDISDTRVADLSPLKGSRILETLNCERTVVNDLSPLRGTALKTLNCRGSRVTNFAPLKETRIENLKCDYIPERDLPIFATIPTLQQVNDVPLKELLEKRR